MEPKFELQFFCFEVEDVYEACGEMFGFGESRIKGTEKVYNSIWVKINVKDDVIVDFFASETDVELGIPTKTLTLSECYQIYRENQKPITDRF